MKVRQGDAKAWARENVRDDQVVMAPWMSGAFSVERLEGGSREERGDGSTSSTSRPLRGQYDMALLLEKRKGGTEIESRGCEVFCRLRRDPGEAKHKVRGLMSQEGLCVHKPAATAKGCSVSKRGSRLEGSDEARRVARGV